MRTSSILLALCISASLSCVAKAQEHLRPLSAEPQTTIRYIAPEYEAKGTLSTGIRRDGISWQGASDLSGSQTPNIKKEVEFKNVQSWLARTDLSYTNNDKWAGVYGEGGFYWGSVLSGEGRDSDYTGDNRSGESSRITGDTSGGHMSGFSAALGYSLRWDQKDHVHRLTPVLGYARDYQNISFKNGTRSIGTGSAAGLSNQYHSMWHGPFVGLDYQYNMDYTHYFRLRSEYHFAYYKADMDWNLRDDLAHPKSFKQEAEGDGLVLSLFYQYFLTEFFGVNALVGYQQWQAEGTETTNALSGATKAKLKDVTWDNYTFMGGVSYKF